MVQSGWYAVVCVIALEKPGPSPVTPLMSWKMFLKGKLQPHEGESYSHKMKNCGGNINESEVLKVSDGGKKYLEIFFLAIDAAEFTPNQSRSSLTKSTAR